MTILTGSVLLAGTILTTSIKGFLKQRKIDRFSQQLMESLETIVSALRAGSSFLQALTAAQSQSEEPFAGELQTVLEEYRLGLPIEEGLGKLAQRMPIEELQSLMAAIRISQASGGSLASILHHLSKNLREQQQLKQRIGALAAQGKLQGLVTLLLPYVLLTVMYGMEPGLVREFFGGPAGEPVIGAMLLAQVLALWAMQAITRVRV